MGSEEFSSLRLRRIATKLEGAVSSTNFTRQAEPDEPVTPCGRLFCQPNMNCYIMCTLGFKNPINLPDFKRALQETLVKHKRFHSVMVSFPYSKKRSERDNHSLLSEDMASCIFPAVLFMVYVVSARCAGGILLICFLQIVALRFQG
jgi:hypothetical protein